MVPNIWTILAKTYPSTTPARLKAEAEADNDRDLPTEATASGTTAASFPLIRIHTPLGLENQAQPPPTTDTAASAAEPRVRHPKETTSFDLGLTHTTISMKTFVEIDQRAQATQIVKNTTDEGRQIG